MASSRFTAVNGSEKLFLKLYPEHLGELRIEIMQSDGKWTAKFTAVNAHIKEAIESNLHQLKQGLNQQSLHIDKIEVFQSHSHPGRELPQEQSGRQREQHQQSRRDEAGRTDFEDSLSEEIANLTE
nr:flagellar hook-length control protein FliK [Metabacillus mangrovi]